MQGVIGFISMKNFLFNDLRKTKKTIEEDKDILGPWAYRVGRLSSLVY